MNRTLLAILVSIPLACAPLIAGAQSGPADATLDISSKSVAVGVGYTQGKDTLHYQGTSYPVDVKGLSAGQVGVSSMTAAGEVYHLANLQDFDGNYTAVSAGAAVAGGGTAITMQNQRGVLITPRATTGGLDVRLSVDGFSLKLAQ